MRKKSIKNMIKDRCVSTNKYDSNYIDLSTKEGQEQFAKRLPKFIPNVKGTIAENKSNMKKEIYEAKKARKRAIKIAKRENNNSKINLNILKKKR